LSTLPKFDKNKKEIIYRIKESFTFNTFIENGYYFKILINEVSTLDDNKKIKQIINESDIVIVFFQINSRESFEELGSYFLYLKNDCSYQNRIILLANIYNKQDILTSDEEMAHFIKKTDMRNFSVIKLNVKDTKQLVKEFDLVLDEYKTKYNNIVMKKDGPWNDY